MYIDYVRIYQKEGEESITCDPRKQGSAIGRGVWANSQAAGYYTTEYISKHPRAYNSDNFTVCRKLFFGGEADFPVDLGRNRLPMAQESANGRLRSLMGGRLFLEFGAYRGLEVHKTLLIICAYCPLWNDILRFFGSGKI